MNWPHLLCKPFGTSVPCVKGKVAFTLSLCYDKAALTTVTLIIQSWIVAVVFPVALLIYEELLQDSHAFTVKLP